jgi:hypothetical protein
MATIVVVPISKAAQPTRRSLFEGFSGNERHERQLTPQPNTTTVYQLRPLFNKDKENENDYELTEPIIYPYNKIDKISS